MAETFPSTLAMKAFADGRALPGAAFVLSVTTTRLAVALLPIGPADASGEYQVSGDRLALMTSEAQSLAIMDHGVLTGELWIRVLNLADVAGCREGFKTWGVSGIFPVDYLDQLDAFEAALFAYRGEELRVTATAIGGTMHIGTSIQRA